VRFSILEAGLHQILSLVDRVIRRWFTHVNGPELRLSTAKQLGHRSKRWRLLRISWRVSPRHSAVDDCLAQPQGKINDSVLGARWRSRVEIVRATNTRQVGIKPI